MTPINPASRPPRCARRLVSAALLAALLVSGCGDGPSPVAAGPGDSTCDGKLRGKPTVTVWFHNGQGPERDAFQQQIAAFNRQSTDVQAKLVVLPETDYPELLQRAAESGDLPDLLDFDGPNLYSYAWSGKLRPLDSCVPAGLRSDLLPSIRAQGSYADRLWGIGTFDSGMGLHVRRSALRRIGVAVPQRAQDAWTATQFTSILRRLKAAGYRHPLDIKINTLKDRTEFATYALAPALWSAGGDLIDRRSYRTAKGVLDSPASVRAMTVVQSWAKLGLIDPNAKDDAFVSGRSPISWVGHWEVVRYSKAFPGDVQIAPLPRFGAHTKTGMGSWQWGIPASAADGDAVWRLLSFLLSPREILRMTTANGAIPARRSVLASTSAFRVGGPERLYVDQLVGGVAVPRPSTPAYPVITRSFARAVRDILAGGDVRFQLGRAADRIDHNIAANGGYPSPG